MLVVLVLTAALLGFGLTVMTAVQSAKREGSSARQQFQRFCIAEAGLRIAIVDLSSSGTGSLGTAGAPLAFGAGTFTTECVDHGDGTWTVTSRGRYAGGNRVLRGLVRETGHVFDHALFAGNASGDLNYSLELGGTGVEADHVDGGVYSGNDVTVSGDAVVSGAVRAGGQIHGATGEEGAWQPPFDFSGIDYEATADVLVAQEFAAHGVSASDDAGGTAMQVPANLDSHVFRKNPSDRATEIGGTTKDDYFLEDPYEPVGVGSAADGSDAYQISLPHDPGASGYRKVIYVDGNLWLHNVHSFTFRLGSIGTGGTQVTFVVRGNIYFSDNLVLDDADRDGVAFIALRDAAVPDSGNIYFGDTRFGTLERMHAFMYAENDFHDNALDATGSARVEVRGTMAAGNQVSINRDYASHHSRLSITADGRLRDGTLSLPGIPQQTQGLRYELVSWIEVSPDA